MSTMQDPATRRYISTDRYRGADDGWVDDECLIDVQSFVRVPCQACLICNCSARDGGIELGPCNNFAECSQCWNSTPHGKCIVIAVAGACRRQGPTSATATSGVFYNINSTHNKAFSFPFQVDPSQSPSSQRAEVLAAKEALTTFDRLYRNDEFWNEGFVDRVVIKTDSGCLFNGIAKWIVDWRDNGYKNRNGNHLLNKQAFRDLDDLCNKLDNMGVEVRFWHVPRVRNRPAVRLANSIFSRENVSEYSADDCFQGGRKPSIF